MRESTYSIKNVLSCGLGLALMLCISIAQTPLFASTQEPLKSAPSLKIRVTDPAALSIGKARNVATETPPNPSPPIPPVFDHPDIQMRHRLIASTTLESLPRQCRATLQSFHVRYDHPSSRGLAGARSMILSGNVPDEEFRALFVHEFGHVTDLGCLEGTPEGTASAFRDGSQRIYENDPSVRFYRISWESETKQRSPSLPEDFVSGYAASDPFEDFAESFAYFVLQPEAFRMRARENQILAAKLRFLETAVFQGRRTVASGLHRWNGTVPWDVTKLTYVWKEQQKTVAQR